jgi:hypothetical protein
MSEPEYLANVAMSVALLIGALVVDVRLWRSRRQKQRPDRYALPVGDDREVRSDGPPKPRILHVG